MSEEDLKEALKTGEPEPEPEPQPQPEPDPAPEPDPEPEYTEEQWREAQAESARANGWKPLDEFVKAGGDPKQWVSAEAFNIRGEFIGKLRDKDRKHEREVSERVANVEKLYKARINELENKRREAVEAGNTEEFERLDKEIGELKAPPVQPQPANDEVEQWNRNNPWIFEKTPKASFAKDVFGEKVQSGMDPVEAIRVMESEVAKHYPDEKGGHVPPSEKGKGQRGFKSKSKALSMDDLNAEEKSLWKNAADLWGGDESKFLKAVKDARDAEEKGK